MGMNKMYITFKNMFMWVHCTDL